MRPLRIFYLVFGYILLFAFWWMYLLYEKNEEVFNERQEIIELKQQLHPADSGKFNLEEAHRQTDLKNKRQRIMILTEGAVFLMLLLIGFWQVKKILLREMQLSEQQRNFILSITHEFKSPLASIRLTVQTLLRKNKDNPLQTELLQRSIQDTDRLGSLVDNLLLAAKIEQDQYGFREEEINFSEMVQSAALKYKDFRPGISFQHRIVPDMFVMLDPTAAWSLVGNLLENAIKYTAENSTISIELLPVEKEVHLRIADRGAGIPPEERRKIFRKFYRMGSEITRTAKGTGIGLFIVQQIADLYKGKVWIEDNPGGGSVFTISLPRTDNS